MKIWGIQCNVGAFGRKKKERKEGATSRREKQSSPASPASTSKSWAGGPQREKRLNPTSCRVKQKCPPPVRGQAMTPWGPVSQRQLCGRDCESRVEPGSRHKTMLGIHGEKEGIVVCRRAILDFTGYNISYLALSTNTTAQS